MTLRLLLLLALTLSAPAATRSEAPAPGGEPSRPATALGPEVPRGAMARFLDACREGHYARAAEYLNLRQLPQAVRAQRGPELARELETVLDRALWVDLDRLSDEPEGDPEDGLPALRDSLGTIETATGPVEVLIERVSQPGGVPVWKIAASTVGAIPALYEEFGWGPLANVLPAPFFQLRFLQIRLWQWIGLTLLVAAAWLAAKLLGQLALGLARRLLAARPTLDARLAEHASGPLRFAIGLAVFAAGLRFLAVALAAQKTVENLFGSVSLVADQPVRVGDVCRFGDTVGTVEDIGLRSTRVRTVDRTLVTIPNAQFSTLALENLSQRDRIPVRATVTLPQGTSAERVRQVLAALREMVVSHPKVHADSARARFVRMGPQALELELIAYVLTARWDEFVEIREQIFLRALEVVGAGAALK